MIYEKAIELNIDLKLNVDEQKNEIKYKKKNNMILMIKIKFGKLQLIKKTHELNKAVYATCNETFAMKNGLKKQIQEEHTELW